MKHLSNIISVFLCAAILMSSVVISASAETNLVKTVHLYADVPYAGRTADFSARTAANAKEQGYKLYFCYEDSSGINHAVKWYDKTAKKSLKPGDRFEKGHEYTQTVAICTEYGFEFPYQKHVTNNGVINWSHDFDEITLNSESVTPYSFDLSHYREWLYVSRTYSPCTEAPASAIVDEVAVKNVDYPMAGNSPDFDVTTTGDGYGLHENSAYAVNWYAVKGEYLISLDSDDVFTVGTTYRVDITLKASYGYRFKYDNPDTPNMKSTTINGLMASCVNTYNYVRHVPERELKISYTFPSCPGDVISQIEITGVTVPVAGQTPSYEAVMLTDACDFSGYEDSKNKNGICWYDKTAGDFLRTTDTFTEGHEYTVSFEIFANEGFRFDKGNVTATVNGNDAEVTYYTEGDTKHYVEYTFEPCFGGEYITSVDITNVVPPAVGEKPVYNASVSEGCTITHIDWGWEDIQELMDPEYAFEDGNTYGIFFWIEPSDTENFRFTNSMIVTVNGKEATYELLDDGRIFVEYIFPPCGTVDSTPDCVKGDANGDGKVNISDATIMLKYIAKWDVEINTDAADVTGDGKVNVADVSLLLKYLAKWDVEFK